MESETSQGSDPLPRGRMSDRVRAILRWTVAIVVAAGLLVASRNAILQWHQQQRLVLDQIADLETEFNQVSTPDERSRIANQIDSLNHSVPYLANLDWQLIVLAMLFYGVGLIPGGMVLGEAARTLGHSVRSIDATSAQIVGHLGKYVPGKAMVVVIRAGRLNRLGVPLLIGSAGVFMETFLMMAVGAAVAGAIIFFLPVPRWIGWCALIGGVVATIPTVPPLLNRLVKRLKGRRNSAPATAQAAFNETEQSEKNPASPAMPQKVHWRFFALAWLWQIVAWGLIGAAMACLVLSVPGIRPPTMTTPIVVAASIASIALAMVAGFASLLPGGAGIRELTLAIVLAPVVGDSRALLAAILARLVFIVVELSLVGIIFLRSRFRRSTKHALPAIVWRNLSS